MQSPCVFLDSWGVHMAGVSRGQAHAWPRPSVHTGNRFLNLGSNLEPSQVAVLD